MWLSSFPTFFSHPTCLSVCLDLRIQSYFYFRSVLPSISAEDGWKLIDASWKKEKNIHLFVFTESCGDFSSAISFFGQVANVPFLRLLLKLVVTSRLKTSWNHLADEIMNGSVWNWNYQSLDTTKDRWRHMYKEAFSFFRNVFICEIGLFSESGHWSRLIPRYHQSI